MRRKKLWFSLAPLVLVHIVVLGAVFFAPYDPAEQRRDVPFLPPTRIHFVDPDGKLRLPPYVCPSADQTNGFGSPRYVEDCSHTYPLRFFSREEPNASRTDHGMPRHLFGVEPPGRVFLLGTDDYGRDVLSRFLHGGQVSLLAGLLATGLALSMGFLLGSVAGYWGSWLDDAIMRGAEVFMALPWTYLLFAVRAFLPLHVGARQSFFLLVAVIGCTGWARPARLIRGVVLSAKQRDFVLAARGFGASGVYLLRRHLLPETAGVVLTQAALLLPQCVLAEVTLSFLGLGVGEPVASWGNLLAGLQKYYVLKDYWWMYIPGLVLVPIFLLYYMLTEAVAAQAPSGELTAVNRSLGSQEASVTI